MSERIPDVDEESLQEHVEGEVGRRLVHASGAVIPLSSVAGLPWLWLQACLLAAVLVVGLLEAHRLRSDPDWWIYRHLTREYETETIAGYALYVCSMAIVSVAFPPHIAVPAMLMLAIADPVGGILGGPDPIPVKRPRAFLGAFAVSAAIAYPFVPPEAAVVGGVAASLADGCFVEIEGHVVDDNLTIPIAAATTMALAVAYWPI